MFEKQKEEAEKQLKEEWGDKYEGNLNIARKAIIHFGGDKVKELTEAIDRSGIGDDPVFIKFMYEIGKNLVEDNFIIGGKESGKQRNPNEFYYPSMEGL